nr:hypothetical protein [Fredinandcohnia onubensis]
MKNIILSFIYRLYNKVEVIVDMFFASRKNNDMLHKLMEYTNQQVVMNWYEDEQLIERNGFFFSCLRVEDNTLHFIKDNEVKQTISLKNYQTIEILPDFRDFFQLTNGAHILQIYFPH